MSLVIDSSITLAWAFTDERTEATKRIQHMVEEAGAWVPIIWRLEVANGLQQGIRQRRIDVADRSEAIASLSELDITIDQETNSFAWTNTIALADRYRLTTYDACYLELAQRRNLPLATLDKDLQAAAKKIGIPLL